MSIVLRLEANASVPAPDSAHSTLYVTCAGELVLRNTANATQVFSTSSYGNTEVAAYLPTYTGNLGNVTNIAASGYIYANSGTIAGAILTGNLSTAAQPNITSVGTLTSLSVSGNIDGGTINANGIGLTCITGANVTGAVTYASTANAVAGSNVTGAVGLATYATTANAVAGANVSGAVSYATTANAVAGANVSGEVSFAATANAVAGGNVSGTVANATYSTCAGTVVTAAQGNITSVGTLTSLSVSGNIDTGNLNSGAVVSATGNVIGGNINTGGIVSATGNICGSYFIGNGSCLTGLSTTSISNGTSNVCVTASDGNVAIGVGGTANIILATTAGANITGNLGVSSNIIIGSGTGGNISNANVISAVAFVGSGNTQLASLGVGTAASGTSGEIRATNNITAYYSSDRKFKENVQDIPAALDKVAAIGGKTFDWTDEYIAQQGGADGYFIRKSDFGVIAQDVQAVFPQAVRTREDGTLAVDYEKLVALAFAAIVELKTEVAALKK